MNPLKNPASVPTARAMRISVGIEAPPAAALPTAYAQRAMIEAIEISMSPHMMMKIIGRAMIAFSLNWKVAFIRLNQLRKYRVRVEKKMMMKTKMIDRRTSHMVKIVINRSFRELSSMSRVFAISSRFSLITMPSSVPTAWYAFYDR